MPRVRFGTVARMSGDSASALLVERRPDGVAVLTLNDPGRRNAMSDEMTAAWKAFEPHQ